MPHLPSKALTLASIAWISSLYGDCFCLGPENTAGNASVRPITCEGDLSLTASAFYWKPNEDGLEFALDSQEEAPQSYETPQFKWDFGFKFGLNYTDACQGWDFNIVWTHYKARAAKHIQAEEEGSLITLWSAYAPPMGLPPIAKEIQAHWNLDCNLADFELGREFWVSKYVTLRPYIGIRMTWLYQDYCLEQKGGSWGENLQNEVELRNTFRGAGLRGGLDTVWHLSCGWGIYSNLALSMVTGRFELKHEEVNRETISPFQKEKILDTHYRFLASRSLMDIGLGLQWEALFCNCRYGICARLGWENHLFFHQNQMWSVRRTPESPGENVFKQRNGTLSTQGWTLFLRFSF